MSWMASLPAGLLVVIWLAIALGIAAGSRVAVRMIVPAADADLVHDIAAPLMPALGATFAVLMALTLSSEAGYLRSAQDIVSNEAAAASRLAWAATSPGVDARAIQQPLRDYLRATVDDEWRRIGGSERDDPATGAAIARLEGAVRTQAARSDLGTPIATELLAALDALTSARRARIGAATREIPLLYVVTLLVSGVALVINASALATRSSTRTALLLAGLATVVGLTFALLFALSGPWEGPLIVGRGPVNAVVRDLDAGFFHTAAAP